MPLLACASEETSEDADEAPYAFRAGAGSEVVDSGPAPAPLSVDWRGVPAFIAQNQAHGTVVLLSLETLFASFMTSGKIVDVTKLPAKNADDMAAAMGKKMCPTGAVTHTLGTPYFTVDFGASCTLGGSGLRASGVLLVGLTASSSGTPWAAVDLTIAGLGLDGYTLDGHATIATNGVTDTLDTRVALSGLGTIGFRGVATGDVAGVTVDGTGTWSGTELSAPDAPDGWRCVSARQGALTVRKLHRTSSDCYPNGGSVGVVTPFLCSRGTESVSTASTRLLVSTSTATFLATTPAAHGVAVSVSVPEGSTSPAAVTMTAPLPQRSCD